MTGHLMKLVDNGEYVSNEIRGRIPTVRDARRAYELTGWQPTTCALARRRYDEDDNVLEGAVGCLVGVLAAKEMQIEGGDNKDLLMVRRIAEAVVCGAYGLTKGQVMNLEGGFDSVFGSEESFAESMLDPFFVRGREIAKAVFPKDRIDSYDI